MKNLGWLCIAAGIYMVLNGVNLLLMTAEISFWIFGTPWAFIAFAVVYGAIIMLLTNIEDTGDEKQ